MKALFCVIFCVILALGALPTYAQNPLPKDQSARLQAGLGVQYKTSITAAKDTTSVVPIAFYDNNQWYIEGAEAGFYPYKTQKHHVRLGLTYQGTHFDPKDAPTPYSDLDKRKGGVAAVGSYMYVSAYGGIRTKITSNNKGTQAQLAHISRFTWDKTTIYPSFGITWQNQKYNEYYYQISPEESARTAILPYAPKDGISPFVSLTAKYDINDSLTLFANQRIDWLSSTQKNSPITEQSAQSATVLGVLYNF